MTIVTLITDFGSGDYATGVLHGVIWGIAPECEVIDLTHDIPRHALRQAGFVLERAVPYFPAGTVHVVVVDPGVGTSRRPLAACLENQYFVGPDNGVFTQVLRRARNLQTQQQFVHLDRPRYWLPEISTIFHGRDIFAPAAAYLARGAALAELGTPVTDVLELEIAQPVPTPHGWQGEVVQVDAFGNLSTNLELQHLGGAGQNLQVNVRGSTVHGLVRTFGEGKPGELVTLFDSSGRVCICEVNGSASRRLRAQVGDRVEVVY
jgi:S-adenosylmethionine hydrolase